MAKRGISGCNFDGGFSSLIYEESLDDEAHPSNFNSNQDRQPVLTPRRNCRLAEVSLALLAAVLLLIDIGLGVHYNKLTDTYLKLNETEHISNELAQLEGTYKTAVESTKGAKKQLDSEIGRQTPTNWELEHQTRRSKNYEEQVVKLTKDSAALRRDITMMSDGCKHCAPGWILMNSVCYYFPFSDRDGLKSWQTARQYCQMYGGDLAVIDSKEKENATVNHLINNKHNFGNDMGFWIGLKYFPTEGTWKWLEETVLVEGYWNDGEPNSNKDDQKYCAVVNARENFFKGWDDVMCTIKQKWICEKALTSTG
ncbi:C-type lectin domain family 4 member A-like [Plectropomus leopardus]|uniref:C-type lectin domain family 4 member A-like n=1 Tax=Plectropomus leopardus TaxID=160734 RepID=UPI001C4D2BB6|nr:C-type lectin domain family 4 member A-like [Plectropomus leopardus]